MSVLVLLLIQLSLLAIGWLLLQLVPARKGPETWGTAYLFGSGLVTIAFLGSHQLGLVLNQTLFLGIVLAIVVSLTTWLWWQNQLRISLNWPRLANWSCFERILLGLIILLVSSSFVENLHLPVTDWDALALYDFRAQVIAQTGSLDEGIRLGYFFQYPPYTSFLHVFGYLFDAPMIRVVYSLIYGSFILTFYGLLRRQQSRLVALTGALFLATDTAIFAHASIAYTNLSYVAFMSLGLLYLGYWWHQGAPTDLIIGSALIALSTWVRAADPFWYIGAAVLLLGLWKHRSQSKIILYWLIVIISLYKYWDFFVATLQMQTTTPAVSRESIYLELLWNYNETFTTFIANIPAVLLYFWQHSVSVVRYLLLPVTIAGLYELRQKISSVTLTVLMITLAMLALIIAGISIFSLFYETWNQIGGSLERLTMVITPLLVFSIFNNTLWTSSR